MQPESCQKIAHRIRSLRRARDLSQDQLAALVETAQSNISSWELGRTAVPAPLLRAIARALRCTADYLLGLTDHAELLPPGWWLLDADTIDRIRSARRVSDLRHDAEQVDAIKIPERPILLPPNDYIAWQREREAIAARLRSGGRREGPSHS